MTVVDPLPEWENRIATALEKLAAAAERLATVAELFERMVEKDNKG